MGAMGLFRFLFRLLLLVVGAVIGVGLFLFAVLTFTVVVLVSLLSGRKPDLQFRVSRNPWAHRRASAPAGDVVDIEAREVKEAAAPLPPPQA